MTCTGWRRRTRRSLTIAGRAALAIAAAAALVVAIAPSAQAADWTRLHLPTDGQSLAAVSCISPSFCEAVGAGRFLGLAERWNGRRWTVQRTPFPLGAAVMQLNGVACVTPTACVAVGFYIGGGYDREVPLIESWNGRSWASQPTPDPDPASRDDPLRRDAILTNVSCSSARACVAVGTYGFGLALSGSSGTPLVEVWNGRRWSLRPVPGAEQGSSLSAVSCTPARVCIGVGAGWHSPIIERGAGAGWSPDTFANPTGATLEDVTCMKFCTTVGFAADLNGFEQPLVGTRPRDVWIFQRIPVAATLAALESVSCPATGACVAVGGYSTAGGATAPLVAQSVLGRWSVRRLQSGADAPLQSVSCVAAWWCMAVGDGLAERYSG
jgi:hypothetical protein